MSSLQKRKRPKRENNDSCAANLGTARQRLCSDGVGGRKHGLAAGTDGRQKLSLVALEEFGHRREQPIGDSEVHGECRHPCPRLVEDVCLGVALLGVHALQWLDKGQNAGRRKGWVGGEEGRKRWEGVERWIAGVERWEADRNRESD